MSDTPIAHEPPDPGGSDSSPARPASRGNRTGAAARAFLDALRADIASWAERRKQRRRLHRPAVRTTAPPHARRGNLGRLFARAFAGVAIVFLIAVGAFAGTMFWALEDLPLEPSEAAAGEPTILLEAANGEPLGRVGQFRIESAPREAFPDHLVNAVLSIEDRRFYSHFGIDPRGIMRAARRNMQAGEIVEGGSTITQQLVKMLALDDERTLTRKVREAFTAIWLETRLSKDEILTRYLNLVYMGSNAHGVPAAARLYFDKGVSELTLAEAALLAGVIRAPSEYSPMRDLELAQNRAATVLQAMVESGAIDAETAAQAQAEPAVLIHAPTAAEAGSWFADWAAEETSAVIGSFGGTLRVRTTLDPDLQRLAEQAVNRSLSETGADAAVSQAALVAMRLDGSVVAMVGGRDYRESQFNRAVQAQRQPGSAFKLFVYLAALRHGFQPEDRIEDAPIEVDDWKPENFGGEEYGVVTLAEAFALSINRVAARLALEVGPDEVIAAARDLGLDAPLGEHPSLALGTEEVSLLDLTSAYASVAAESAPVEPWGVAAFGAETETQLQTLGPPAVERRSLGAQREQLIRLLQLTVAEGTGRHAALDGAFAAGKTGTSQNHRDAWFIGFNESLVVGVWVGNDDGSPMDEVTGGSLPALIWKDFMTGAAPLEGASGEIVAAVPSDTLGAAIFGAPQSDLCNISACAQEYRSFRASDCTYQPYDGPRRLCDIPAEGSSVPTEGSPQPFVQELLVERQPEILQPLSPEPVAVEAVAETAPAMCDVAACAATYTSFRASDCTYQPFGGGPREICDSPGAADPGQPLLGPPPVAAVQEPILLLQDGTPVILPADIFGVPQGGACNVAACAAEYSSFDPMTCTYQPLDGGPRQLCTR